MAREVVTRRTVLHHYCSTRICFEPPTQSVTFKLESQVALISIPQLNVPVIHRVIRTN